MKEVSDITACVVDHGLFVPIAQKLGEQYKRVFYWSPWDTCFPEIEQGVIGDGFDNIERVSDFWEVKRECDLFVFPDIGFGAVQQELLSQGFPVWGHHGGDVLETNRGRFLKMLEHVGLTVPTFKKITGIEPLREFLKDKTDKYIKISKWRGNWETLHWLSWKESRAKLDDFAAKRGPASDLFTFYVFDAIDTDIEDGIDAYSIDGNNPSLVMHGMERKDKSYICSVQKMSDIDERVRIASERIAPVLKSFGYRGFMSTEVRIKGEKSYFIDPTLRAASPVSQLMVELFANLGEIIWRGANGDLVDPVPTAAFGAQALITVDRRPDEWITLRVPQEIRQWVKCGFACEIDGAICEPPDKDNMAGWLVSTGDTLKEAIQTLKERAALLPDNAKCDVESIGKLLEEAETAKSEGIELSESPIPGPEVVIN